MNAGESLSTPAQLAPPLCLLSLFFGTTAALLRRPLPFQPPVFTSTHGSDGRTVFPTLLHTACERTNGMGQTTPHILYYVISSVGQGSCSRYSLAWSRFTFAHLLPRSSRPPPVSFSQALIVERRSTFTLVSDLCPRKDCLVSTFLLEPFILVSVSLE